MPSTTPISRNCTKIVRVIRGRRVSKQLHEKEEYIVNKIILPFAAILLKDQLVVDDAAAKIFVVLRLCLVEISA